MKPIDWTQAADQALLDMRAAGRSWPEIARAVEVGRSAAIERARQLGLAPARRALAAPASAPPQNDREALPPGHPVSWGALTQGTLLADMPYPFPVYR